MFGIGLDDAFIIITSYVRTDPKKDPVERVHDTIDEVGISIFMTTATSVLAFSLGCMSSLPAIRWLCLYAFPTVAIDFIYQITFFIALVVLDERRIKNRRRDCLVCCVVKKESPPDETPENDGAPDVHIAERIMSWYADRLLRPWMKALVLAVFAALFASCFYGASLMKVAFDFTSVLPSDSYIISFQESLDKYAQIPAIGPFVYFRNVDQSDPQILLQMESYVNDLVEIDAISKPPFQFWVRDFQTYLIENPELTWLTFNETLHMFLALPENKNFQDDFIFDAEGNIKASRTHVEMDNLDLSSVDNLIATLKDQRRVGSEQPANQDGDWSFFTFDHIYYLWEFLNITKAELMLTTIIGIASVSVMGLLFMPHWSGVFFVGPLIAVLYVDLMGFLQFAGVTINGGT